MNGVVIQRCKAEFGWEAWLISKETKIKQRKADWVHMYWDICERQQV